MRSQLLWACAGLSLLLAPPAPALAQAKPTDCERAAHPVTELGNIFMHGHTIQPNEYPYPIANNDARYISARIELKQPGECDWVLVVRTQDYKLVQTLTRADFAGAEKSVWTARVYGTKVLLDLQQCQAGQAPPVFYAAEYLAMPKVTKLNPYYSKLFGAPRWHQLYTQDEQYRPLGDFIGLFRASWDRAIWSCSGAMIAPDLFITNWHCGAPRTIPNPDPSASPKELPFPESGYWDPLILSTVTIDLSWDGDAISRDFVVTEKGVVACSKELDFAVLEVKPLNYAGKVQPAPVRREQLGSESIRVVHHPLSADKQISFCEVVSPAVKGWRAESGDDVDFTHQCDTEAGSSGAPVFDSKRRVVGLHHAGFDLDPTTCQPRTPKLNKAVRIDKILKYLNDNYQDVYKRIP